MAEQGLIKLGLFSEPRRKGQQRWGCGPVGADCDPSRFPASLPPTPNLNFRATALRTACAPVASPWPVSPGLLGTQKADLAGSLPARPPPADSCGNSHPPIRLTLAGPPGFESGSVEEVSGPRGDRPSFRRCWEGGGVSTNQLTGCRGGGGPCPGQAGATREATHRVRPL